MNGLSESDKIGVQAGTTAQYYIEGDEEWGFPDCLQSVYHIKTVLWQYRI